MDSFGAFMNSALPWIAIGILAAVFLAFGPGRKKSSAGSEDKSKNKEEKPGAYTPKENYGLIGMCLGLSVGCAIGSGTGNTGTGMTVGMAIGFAVGSLIEKK